MLRSFSIRLSLSLVITALALSVAPAKTLPGAVLVIDAIQCAGGAAELPDVDVSPASLYPKLTYTRHVSQRIVNANGFNVLRLQLPGENYFVRVRSPHCSAEFQVGLISGKGRTVSVALTRRCALCGVRLVSVENAVMGRLPVTPSVGYLVARDSTTTRILDIQDGAYYLERVPPGRYLLRFELHGGFQSEIPLDATRIGNKDALQFDITLHEFKCHLGSILKGGDTWNQHRWCA